MYLDEKTMYSSFNACGDCIRDWMHHVLQDALDGRLADALWRTK